jgi:murein DD-endopeptidase MepM/ murein hydrolase activator NlpD
VNRRAALAAAALAMLAGCPAPSRLVRPAPPAAGAPRPAPPQLQAPPPASEPAPAGAVHVVKPGETVYRIARATGIAPAALMAANGIEDPRDLKVGTRLVLPAAPAASTPPAPAASAAPVGGGAAARASSAAALGAAPPSPRPGEEERADGPARLAWPLHGVLYGRFGVRAGERHDGIDIAAPEGTEVAAAADGTVIYAGEQPAYGAVVILRHEDGLVTLYAHNSAVLVREGARVVRGEPIARVGQTGRTTGPHLHFEVRQGTRPRNPLLFLP